MTTVAEVVAGVCREGHLLTPENVYRERTGRNVGRIRCRACDLRKRRAHYIANAEATKEIARRVRVKLREEVLAAYGGRCVCCGLDYADALTVDHVDGGGNEHRRSLGSRSATNFYRDLKRRGFPPGFQVMCWNCNSVKHRNGVCTIPHGVVA